MKLLDFDQRLAACFWAFCALIAAYGTVVYVLTKIWG